MLHGPGSRLTDECNTLKGQAERMKAMYSAQSLGAKKAYKKKQELNALIALKVQEALDTAKSSGRNSKDLNPAVVVTQKGNDDSMTTESSLASN